MCEAEGTLGTWGLEGSKQTIQNFVDLRVRANLLTETPSMFVIVARWMCLSDIRFELEVNANEDNC